MPLSAAPARILNFSSLVLLPLIAATGGAAVTAGNGNATKASNATVTTTGGNKSATTVCGGDNTETYICDLCVGRERILIRWCPIFWDGCKLVCFPPAAAAAPAPSPRLATPGEEYGEDDQCYVMKLYRDGSCVIVDRRDRITTISCLLSCGGGDAVDEKALGAAAPVPEFPGGARS